MEQFSLFVGFDWPSKVNKFKDLGAQWTKDCGGGSCYSTGTVWSRNNLVRYQLRAKTAEFRSYCVHNWRNSRAGCIDQDTGDVVLLVLRNNRWIKA